MKASEGYMRHDKVGALNVLLIGFGADNGLRVYVTLQRFYTGINLAS